MKKDKNCNIIQDLMPNYIDNLTNKETNLYIDEHLKECSECRKSLEYMKKDLNLEGEKRNSKKVIYLKKFNKKMKILKFILLVIILVFLISTTRKMIIISSLCKKAENYVNSTNYHRITYGYQPDYYVKTEVYTLGEKQAVYTTKIENGETTELKIYGENGKINNMYTNSDGKKVAQLNTNTKMIVNIPNPTYLENNIMQLFFASVFSSINTRIINSKECYYISNPADHFIFASAGDGMYIDKETGLTIRTNANEDGTWPQADYIYEFNTVTEEDFKEPDISEYEIVKK